MPLQGITLNIHRDFSNFRIPSCSLAFIFPCSIVRVYCSLSVAHALSSYDTSAFRSTYSSLGFKSSSLGRSVSRLENTSFRAFSTVNLVGARRLLSVSTIGSVVSLNSSVVPRKLWSDANILPRSQCQRHRATSGQVKSHRCYPGHRLTLTTPIISHFS